MDDRVAFCTCLEGKHDNKGIENTSKSNLIYRILGVYLERQRNAEHVDPPRGVARYFFFCLLVYFSYLNRYMISSENTHVLSKEQSVHAA